MTTMLTPPPTLPPAPAHRPPSAGRVVAILAIVLGAAVILATALSAVASTVGSALVHTETKTAPVEGMSTLDVDVAGGSLTIEYADVDEAQLTVTRAYGSVPWTLRREGDELTVATPDHPFGFGWPFGSTGTATLRLPASVRAAAPDAVIAVSGGALSVRDAAFGELRAETDAGTVVVTGSARTVTAETNAGDTTLRLSDVRTAGLSVSAGSLTAVFGGAAPTAVTADVSAGDLDVTVPAGAYDVTSQVSAGGFDDQIGSTPGSPNTVRVEVSAGSAVLRSSGG